MQTSPYTWLMLAAILGSAIVWTRFVPKNRKLLFVYFAALCGAFLGAKIIYLAAEGWMRWNDPNRWLHLATGKTIVGALLGGYAGVEYAKRSIGYREATGDWFAALVPFSIILGRLGCWLHGCCLGMICDSAWYTINDPRGIARWPAVQMEIAFNLVAAICLGIFRARKILPGQHFHIYLIAYGIFRFAHEFFRNTPRILGPFSGYHFAALAVCALGAIRFAQRSASAKTFDKPAVAIQIHAPTRMGS
jgi:phosphatidylglycerol:prolipoprotein diacylglycerol transferase